MTATAGVIGITMTGTGATLEGVPAHMTGNGGGLHEGLLHRLVDQVRLQSRALTTILIHANTHYSVRL